MTLRTLNYGSYGIFLIMGHAGFCPSAVSQAGLPGLRSGRATVVGHGKASSALLAGLGV